MCILSSILLGLSVSYTINAKWPNELRIMNLKVAEGSECGLIFRYYTEIRVEGLRKIAKILCLRDDIWTQDIPNAKQVYWHLVDNSSEMQWSFCAYSFWNQSQIKIDPHFLVPVRQREISLETLARPQSVSLQKALFCNRKENFTWPEVPRAQLQQAKCSSR